MGFQKRTTRGMFLRFYFSDIPNMDEILIIIGVRINFAPSSVGAILVIRIGRILMWRTRCFCTMFVKNNNPSSIWPSRLGCLLGPPKCKFKTNPAYRTGCQGNLLRISYGGMDIAANYRAHKVTFVRCANTQRKTTSVFRFVAFDIPHRTPFLGAQFSGAVDWCKSRHCGWGDKKHPNASGVTLEIRRMRWISQDCNVSILRLVVKWYFVVVYYSRLEFLPNAVWSI